MLIPETLPPGRKKSKMLLPVIITLSFSTAELVPLAMIAFDGRFAPAGPILQLETVLLSFPVVEPVPKTMVPATVASDEVDEPRIVHLVTVLVEASAINRIVLVPAVAATEVLEIVSEDPATSWPSIVTLSAPLKSINGLPAIAPETVRAPTALIVSEFHELTEG
jgi:hypothetical protein